LPEPLIERQRTLFRLVSEFFERLTGEDVFSFAARGDFGDVIRARATQIAKKGEDAFPWFEREYRAYYGREVMAAFTDARSLGGVKLVLGGASRFTESQLSSVRKMLLYADTILIPDPILPWFEAERKEERFRHVILIEQVFWLLHLQPLVEADLPYPAIVIFPSWERSLETRDETTQSAQQQLIVDTIGYHIQRPFASLDDLVNYAGTDEEEFLSKVDAARILLAPGANEPEPLDEGIKRYWEEIRTWRSKDHLQLMESLPKSHFVLNGLMERLGPQYHMLENAEELRAQPMMCLDAHWFYFKLIGDATQGRLAEADVLSPTAIATLRSINRPEMRWLGNVPISSLVQLRVDNENEHFRRELEGYTASLHAATVAELDRVSAEVARGIAGLIAVHQTDLRKIEQKYRLDDLRTLALGVTTAAALFSPALAPFVGALAPMAVAGKFAYDKAKERQEKAAAARSLTGVLARSKGT